MNLSSDLYTDLAGVEVKEDEILSCVETQLAAKVKVKHRSKAPKPEVRWQSRWIVITSGLRVCQYIPPLWECHPASLSQSRNPSESVTQLFWVGHPASLSQSPSPSESVTHESVTQSLWVGHPTPLSQSPNPSWVSQQAPLSQPPSPSESATKPLWVSHPAPLSQSPSPSESVTKPLGQSPRPRQSVTQALWVCYIFWLQLNFKSKGQPIC